MASEIMRLQHRMAEEFEVLNASCLTSLVDSCFINNGYFLAASILRFRVQHRKDWLLALVLSEMQRPLEKSLAIWSHTNNLSSEASKVVAARELYSENPKSPVHTTQWKQTEARTRNITTELGI